MATTRTATAVTSHRHHAHHANPTATTTLMKKDVQVSMQELLKKVLLLEPDLGLDLLDVVMMTKILKNATVMMIESNCCVCLFLFTRFWLWLWFATTLPPPINWPTLPLPLLPSLLHCFTALMYC